MVDQNTQGIQAQVASDTQAPQEAPAPAQDSTLEFEKRFDPKVFKPVTTSNPEANPSSDPTDSPPASNDTPLSPSDEEIKDAPKLFAGKYKSIDELENGYKNLEKKIGSFAGAPEQYAIEDLNKDAELKFIQDDPDLNSFMELAKKNNMSQEMFDGILNIYRGYVQKQINLAKVDYDKLGPQAEKRMSDLSNFAKNNLTEAGYSRFKKFADSSVKEADLLLLLDDIRQASAPIEGPTADRPMSRGSSDTIAQIKQKIIDNFDKYQKDPTYRSQLRRELEIAHRKYGS